jgi:hypothetical protein
MPHCSDWFPLDCMFVSCSAIFIRDYEWILNTSDANMQIPHLRPAEYKTSRLPRSMSTVNHSYGGVLPGTAIRERWQINLLQWYILLLDLFDPWYGELRCLAHKRIIRAFLVKEKKIVHEEGAQDPEDQGQGLQELDTLLSPLTFVSLWNFIMGLGNHGCSSARSRTRCRWTR